LVTQDKKLRIRFLEERERVEFGYQKYASDGEVYNK